MNLAKTFQWTLASVAAGASAAQAAVVTTSITDGASSVVFPGGGTVTFTNEPVNGASTLKANAAGAVAVSDVVSGGTLIDGNTSFSEGATINKGNVSNIGQNLYLPIQVDPVDSDPTYFGYITFDAAGTPEQGFTSTLKSYSLDATGAAVITPMIASPVPEPASLSMLAAGLAGMAAYRRRRRAAHA